MNTALLAKILETAGHANTSDEEAVAAVRQARALLGRNGKAFADVLGGSTVIVQSQMPTNANVPYAKWVARVAELEAEVEVLKKAPSPSPSPSVTRANDARVLKAEMANTKLNSKITELMVTNRQLNSDVNRLTRLLKESRAQAGEQPTVAEITPSIDVSGAVSYTEWATAVALKLGSSNGWQMAVEEQTRLMGPDKFISRRDIHRWRKRGHVPDMAVEIIKEIQVTEAEEPLITWTATKVAQVRVLVEQKMPEMKIATRLSERWGQRVTDNNIKRLKYDSRNKQRQWQERGWGPPMGAARQPVPAKPRSNNGPVHVASGGTLHATPEAKSAASRLIFTTPQQVGQS